MWKMHKISDGHSVVLSISGRIKGEELFALERALVSVETGHQPIELDLRDVQLVDQEVVTFLVCLEDCGTALRNCPLYIREWISREQRKRRQQSNDAGCDSPAVIVHETHILND
jgi:ABC-type transporter Mla MlaB component